MSLGRYMRKDYRATPPGSCGFPRRCPRSRENESLRGLTNAGAVETSRSNVMMLDAVTVAGRVESQQSERHNEYGKLFCIACPPMGFSRGALWPPNPEVNARVPRNALVIGPGAVKFPDGNGQALKRSRNPSPLRSCKRRPVHDETLPGHDEPSSCSVWDGDYHRRSAFIHLHHTCREGGFNDSSVRKHDGPRYERYRKVKMKITNNPSNEEFWQFAKDASQS